MDGLRKEGKEVVFVEEEEEEDVGSG